MAYVYEINGQRVEFEREPTDADIDEAARQLGPAPIAPSTIGEEAKGVAMAAAVPLAGAAQHVLENPVQSALSAYGVYKGAQLANAARDFFRGQSAGPIAPSTPPAAQPAAQPGVMSRAADTIRQLAASRAMQGVSKIAGAAGAALTPGNIGQNYPFPTSGPLRGSEINPATGRPWTPQELAAYRTQYGQ